METERNASERKKMNGNGKKWSGPGKNDLNRGKIGRNISVNVVLIKQRSAAPGIKRIIISRKSLDYPDICFFHLFLAFSVKDLGYSWESSFSNLFMKLYLRE
jgi:hypothetical protein